MKESARKRKIKYLWHFTRIENLQSILNNGIVPRLHLELNQSDVIYNDQHRIDGFKNASCLSVGHPNYKMFYRIRQENPGQEWIVIACKPEILWTKNCAFCQENAASANVTCIPIDQRRGAAAFERMFAPVDGKPSRNELKLPDDCPTNPQAEILVFDIIEPELIIGAVCQSKARAEEVKKLYPDFEFIYHKSPFSARLDYAHWK